MSPFPATEENPEGGLRGEKKGQVGELAIAKDWKGMCLHLI